MGYRFIAVAAFATFSVLSLSLPAQALTSEECSAKYKAAQGAGTAGGMKYADYRKAECARTRLPRQQQCRSALRRRQHPRRPHEPPDARTLHRVSLLRMPTGGVTRAMHRDIAEASTLHRSAL
jgi:hypothetical protein